ncbi:hypothetical protein C3Y93_04685 [Acinetobacter sp. SWBY1]|nr:hypothetical protein C3Y93_04685 [Acinetobacter sp. SWBY1]
MLCINCSSWGIELVVCCSLQSGQLVANIMTLIQSVKLNGLSPYAYLSDALKRLRTHNWQLF